MLETILHGPRLHSSRPGDPGFLPASVSVMDVVVAAILWQFWRFLQFLPAIPPTQAQSKAQGQMLFPIQLKAKG